MWLQAILGVLASLPKLLDWIEKGLRALIDGIEKAKRTKASKKVKDGLDKAVRDKDTTDLEDAFGNRRDYNGDDK